MLETLRVRPASGFGAAYILQHPPGDCGPRVTETYACHSDAIALKVAAAFIASGAVLVSIAGRTWEPLSGGMSVLLLPLAARWLKRRRIEGVKKKTVVVRSKPDFSTEKYGELVAFLGLDPTLPLH